MSKNPLADGEKRFRTLSFSHAAGMVVAEFERDSPRRVSSLYLRHAASAEYERLPTPDDATSYTSAVLARGEPVGVFNVMKVSPRGGGDWVHLARVHLVTGDVEIVFEPAQLEAMTGTGTLPIRPWVSDLLEVSDDGTIVTCRVGVPEPAAGGVVHMRYSLFDLDLRGPSLTRLADLDTPYW